MRAYDIILKKRDGFALDTREIEYMVSGYVLGTIPDYQMASFLMAVFFRGLNSQELAALVDQMVKSGDTIDLSFIPGRKVDKHSSGGVGDKTSLVVAPLVSACGVPVAKMSGRGLGHTGGTLDKLESIPGFRVSLTDLEFRDAVRNAGIAIAGQTKRLVPADGLMYALRDSIGAVESIPLIASSIMSKKIAGGADAIVLDVKSGSGAFMKDDLGALELAKTMVGIGTSASKETIALVTSMSEPLGHAVGNALEVMEAVETLRGKGPADLVGLSMSLAAEMVALGRSVPLDEARAECERALSNGSAFEKLAQMVRTQHGDERAVYEPLRYLPKAGIIRDLKPSRSGMIASVDALAVGRAAQVLGAGRARKEDSIDHSAGVFCNRKTGDLVSQNDAVFTVHASSETQFRDASALLESAVTIADDLVAPVPVLRHRVDRTGIQSYI